MKMKTVVLIALTLVLPFGLAGATMNPAKMIIAGGYDDDLQDTSEQDGSSQSGDGLKTLRYQARDRLSETKQSSSKGNINSGMVGDYSEAAFGDEVFTDPDKKIAVTHRFLYETAGFLGDASDVFGEVIDGDTSTQVAFAHMDLVYINLGSADNVKVGDQFLVFHAEDATVKHPITKKNLGHKVLVDAVVRVTKTTATNSEALIVRSYDSVERGNKVILYKESEIPGIDPDSPIKPKNIDGYIVASKDPKKGYSTGDVVYLDVGFEAGVEPGDVFDIVDSEKVRRADGTLTKGLPKIIGRAKILSAREETSSALIFTSRDVIASGDKVRFSATRYQ